mgnify:FL=1
MNLPDTIRSSDGLDALFKALAEAQADMAPAVKDGTNPHFKSRYATLAAVLNAILPSFNKHGLSVTQHPTLAEDVVHVTTFVAHASGQWMSSTVGTPLTGRRDAQAVGSAISYLRRYAAQSIAGLPVADFEEDDGNAASSRQAPQNRGRPTASSLVPTRPRPWNAEELDARLAQVDLDAGRMSKWCAAHGRPEPVAMDASKQAQMVSWLEAEGAATVHAWLSAAADMATLEARYVADGSAFVGKPDA